MEDSVKRMCNDIFTELGPGHSESIYHNALKVALRFENVPYETERIIPLEYMGTYVGCVRSDLVVNRNFVVELKATTSLNVSHKIQLTKYLKYLEGVDRGLLVNFPLRGDRVEYYSSLSME
jgi:GxxExxY protein